MVEPGGNDFSHQLSAVARSMQEDPGSQHTLETAIAAALEMITGCDMAGISVVHPDGIDTPAASSETLRRIDELQFALGQGPCLNAVREHETTRCPDLAHDDRWPVWGARVSEELGVASSVSYRLYTTRDTPGALNLYSEQLDGFDADDIDNGLALAAHVAVALAAAQNAENLTTAITNRTVIGQAEGILMERFDMSADQAFEVLRRVSRDGNVKLNAVAAQLVETRRTPNGTGTQGDPLVATD
ncbi:ANTAR domain-containing protein [Ornithinimicrobium sp. LYQ121]|uniref:GAF and ANTAR domain-containing protein n=1 Tax=Ornithinimicrobium sp. LYQ121 TaxID=3378801 RepID=UPI003852D9B7